jgi:hypothetical protein
LSAERDQRGELVGELLRGLVALRAVFVHADARHVVRVTPQLLDDQRRGVEQILEVRELLAPVGTPGGRSASRSFMRSTRSRTWQ